VVGVAAAGRKFFVVKSKLFHCEFLTLQLGGEQQALGLLRGALSQLAHSTGQGLQLHL
jgi:hypothetical protein